MTLGFVWRVIVSGPPPPGQSVRRLDGWGTSSLSGYRRRPEATIKRHFLLVPQGVNIASVICLPENRRVLES